MMDEMVSHSGTMGEWFKEPGAELFFDWLDVRRGDMEKRLRAESTPIEIYRLQGELNGIEKIIRLRGTIFEEAKKGGM